MKNLAIAVAVILFVLPATWATAATWTDDFENTTTYPDGADIGSSADWFANNGAGPTINSGIGVVGSRGGTQDGAIFVWSAHPFSWTSDLDVGGKVVAKLDFETSDTGALDDDRIGWMLKDDSSGSDFIFGVQLDPGPNGLNIEGYWDHVINVDENKRPSIVDVPPLQNSAWYQLTAEFTKLSATSAQVDASLWSLDAGGNPLASIAAGTIADTSTLGGDSPDPEYFTGLAAYSNTLWPAYKNHSGANGDMDNAYFDVLGNPSPYRITDFNHDETVNLVDYDILSSNFLSAGDNSKGDATRDGFIDLDDFVLWRADFEDPDVPSALAGSAVPEPSSLLLGLFLAGMLAATRTARLRFGSVA